MRMLLKAHMDTRKANEGNQDGTLPERLGQLMDQLQPEAAYFYPENVKRTVFIVFDMQDPAQIPPTLEPCSRRGSKRLPDPGDDPRGPAVGRSRGLRLAPRRPSSRGPTAGGGA